MGENDDGGSAVPVAEVSDVAVVVVLMPVVIVLVAAVEVSVL